MPTATPNNFESVDEVEDFTKGHVITYHIYRLLLFSPKSLSIHKSINECPPQRNQQRELSRPRSNVYSSIVLDQSWRRWKRTLTYGAAAKLVMRILTYLFIYLTRHKSRVNAAPALNPNPTQRDDRSQSPLNTSQVLPGRVTNSFRSTNLCELKNSGLFIRRIE